MDLGKVKIRGGLVENLGPQIQQILSIKSFDKYPTQNNQNIPTNEENR